MNTKSGVLKNNCIGLTGGVACGKSTIGSILKELGYIVIDADVLSRKAVEPGSDGLFSVVNTFGEEILNSDGEMNRKKLREIVFNDYSKLDLLEKIITPHIHSLLLQNTPPDDIWFYEAAILLKFHNVEDFKEVWYATCPFDVQVQRLTSRDKISTELAHKMISRQHFDFTNCVMLDTDRELSSLKEIISLQLARVKATSQSVL